MVRVENLTHNLDLIGKQWSEDTVLKVMIVGKLAGHLTFLICQEIKQKMSPTNMNVATLKGVLTLVGKKT